MPYKVMVGNIPIVCDSAQEAVQVAKQVAATEVDKSDQFLPPTILKDPAFPFVQNNSRWSEARVTEFMKNVDGRKKKVLDTLLQYPEGRTHEQLMQVLGWTNGKMLAGGLAGLAKKALKTRVAPKNLYHKQRIRIGDQVTKEYQLTPMFRIAFENWGKM